MQLNRDIVKSARLRLTCTIDRNIINKLEKKNENNFQLVISDNIEIIHQEIIGDCLHSAMG